MKISLLFVTVISIFSCQHKEGLELVLLNDKLHAYCPEGDCRSIENRFVDKAYYTLSKNILKFKITNNEKRTCIFFPYYDNSKRKICGVSNKFPDKFMNISLRNFIVTSSSGDTISRSGVYTLVELGNNHIYETYRDSIINQFYSEIGYGEKSLQWKCMNSEFLNEAILIPPEETLFFETYINLPFNKNLITGGIEKIPLNTNESYKMNLIFRSNINDITKWLTDIQNRNMAENNYMFFAGDLVSTNSIPLITKEH